MSKLGITTHLIDGKLLSQQIKNRLKEEINDFEKEGRRLPHLSVVLIGESPASKIYVSGKEKAANEVGISSSTFNLESNVDGKQVVSLIDKLNGDNAVDAILVQLPLPKHLNEDYLLSLVSPEKDVDGFHPANLGCLFSGRESYSIPCTPAGIIKLIDATGVPISGKSAVVVGRSNIVGKPVAFLLLKKDMTVTICHSKSENLFQVCKTADVLVSAVGKPRFITSEFVKQGAIVVDVGISRVDNKLVGDVDFEDVKGIASHITPVPGGVGPMTIAMLLENTLSLYKKRFLKM